MQPLALVFFLYCLVAPGLNLVQYFFVLDDVIVIGIAILIIKLLSLHLKLFQEVILDTPELRLSVLHGWDLWILLINLLPLG
jgi:hypothetical protein